MLNKNPKNTLYSKRRWKNVPRLPTDSSPPIHIHLPGCQVLVQMGQQAVRVSVIGMVEMEMQTVVGTFPVGQAENTQFSN